MNNKTYRALALEIDRRIRGKAKGRVEWEWDATATIDRIMGTAPHGSGIDSGVSLDIDKSTGERLVFTIPYHRMNNEGYYCEWIDYKMTVKPSLRWDYSARIMGRNREGLRDYVADVMDTWLKEECAA